MDRRILATCWTIALSGVAACGSDKVGDGMTPMTPGTMTTAGAAAPAVTPGNMTMTGAMTAEPSKPTSGAAGSPASVTPAAGSPAAQPGMQPGAQPGNSPSTQAGSGAMDKPGSMDPGMKPATMDPAATMGKGTLPAVMSVKDMGPYAVTIEMNEADGGGWVAHPTEMGKDGVKHPIFLWGCGGGSQPTQYTDHMKLVASHGFIMESHVSNGEAAEFNKPLEWLIAQNDKADSKYYHKLDTSKVAAGGHSMGSIATFAFEATTMKLTTSIHVAGGSFDGNGFMSLKTPTLHVGGKMDTLAGSNTMRDFEKTTVPTFYVNMDDTDHIYAARNGLPVMIAWLRWHLAGETERQAKQFSGKDCEFCVPPYNGQAKNWK
ncbi:MAG TPA: hypothetical protein VJV78_10655 [Polyangiales bacterium]|nr:hypothetical protein [Polyangiales bacterium]